MKILVTAALGGAMVMGAFGLAEAQTVQGGSDWWRPSGLYGTLGYANFQAAEGPSTDLSAIQGRLGARFGRYLGVEGEVSGGVDRAFGAFNGDANSTHLTDQYAGYVVGYLPITPRFELLARVGYGGQDYNIRDYVQGASYNNHYDSLNYGAGGQYFFDPKDGVRVDYTYYNAQSPVQTDSNVWSVSYVRRF